jgi:phosphoglycerate dehydrogenase-like enzyme
MMSDRLKILFLPHYTGPEMTRPWQKDLEAAIDDRHDLRIYDASQPLAPQFEGVDVVLDLGGSMGTKEMADAAAGQVRLWQIQGTGIDHFDLEYWRARSIAVANCPGQFSSVALAECAMMYILMLTRQYAETQANFGRGIFYRPMGLTLDGLSLAIVGFGASGQELARRASSFGMRISAIDIRDVSEEEIDRFNLEFVGKPDELDRVIAACDVLSLHLHLNAQTRHIIDARRLGLLKPTALLINVARGELVDEAALGAALAEGRLAGAGLDTFAQEPPDLDEPIFSMPNVITTPHIAGVTDGTSRNRAGAGAENIERIAAGLEPLYRVD